ncbi:MAG: hypothetical protein Kow0029_18370 [Candidatus Rifleibacteriota bacterium]
MAAAVATGTLPALPPGEEIYDLMSPVAMPYPWLTLVLKFILGLLALYIVYRFWNWIRIEPVRIRTRIIQSPEKLAERAIERLKLSPVWEKRQMKEICEALVVILKTYLHDAHGIGLGAAATSDEMIEAMRRQNVPSEALKKCSELFDICDRIKFTGKVVEADAENLLAVVKELVSPGVWSK